MASHSASERLRSLKSSLLALWNTPEKPKAALQQSVWVALSRCLIHIVPVTASGFLLWINYHHYYIGSGFSYQQEKDNVYLALYQVASKLEESTETSTYLLQSC